MKYQRPQIDHTSPKITKKSYAERFKLKKNNPGGAALSKL